MDKKVLLEWKTSNTKVYTRFKQDLERQLSKPYHQTILDLGDGNAEPLCSAIASFTAITSANLRSRTSPTKPTTHGERQEN